MKENSISFIVCNFNSSLDKILLTVASCIKQKDVDFELIYVDDGSKNSYENEIKAFLENNNVTDFKLICSKQNQGTLLNLLNGLRVAKYPYTKMIGAGDLLYDESTAKVVLDFFEKTKTDIVLTNCVYFYDGGEIKTFRKSNPNDYKYYSPKKYNQYKVQKRLFLNQDLILGASIFANVERIKALYEKFIGIIKYAEDTLLTYAAFDNYTIKYLNRYTVFYEYGSGISTDTNSTFSQIIRSEYETVYKEVENMPLDEVSQKIVDTKQKWQSIKNPAFRKLYKFIKTPSQAKIKLNKMFKRKHKANFDFYHICKEAANNGL